MELSRGDDACNLTMQAYRVMLTSREFDDECERLLSAGHDLPHYHSGRGQEALTVGPAILLRRSDTMIYTHRGYGQLLAKGVSLSEIAKDLLNRAGGTNHGLGGVLHVSKPDLGVPGREGVFGTRFGISVGIALALQRERRDDVVLCYFGDAAGSRGALYEALNMAVLWRLPIVFIAENNGWSVSTRTPQLYPRSRLTNAWPGLLPVDVVDGNDLMSVIEAVSARIDQARKGQGPSMVEGLTYRMAPHHWKDTESYRDSCELKEWAPRDPVARAHELLLSQGVAATELERASSAAVREVREAFAEAFAAPEATWRDAAELGLVPDLASLRR
jgi:acetoin:2,6-dichlorophenolindophenol oxidoreductase subunit alpha